ncbi:uncharacterized protein LOC113295595 [Papaver somniferum]|uniref:uncharacterized protein LOC113295595 n=1 Tax=Papaver somniferum TaxID=3469 RepID=UPI000E6FE976|nr:uncharacterized protein LOC113295595 [Papaver somniferum]
MGDPVDPNHIVAPSKIVTYADRLKGRKELPKTSVDLSSLPNPTLEDGKPSIEIPNELYLEGCALWKFSLIGRLDFKELSFSDAKRNLELQWQLGEGRVHFVPLNRGFFIIIKLLSQEDKVKILQDEQWVVAKQKLNLMEWFPSFDADKQRSSRSTVWVKFPGIPVEFWIEKTLLAMGKTLGSPIVVDKRTLAHEYGHFASVLIDIDFAELKSDDINVTVGEREFCQPFEILKRPKFCSKCSIIGHSDGECRKKTRGEALKAPLVTAESHQAIVDVVELEQQLQDSLAQSEAVLRMASAEVEKYKQVILTHSVLASKARSLSTSSLNAKAGGNVELARTKLPPPARIDISSSSTPLCNALEETSEFVSNNKFNILSDKAGNDLLVFSKLGELTKQAKRQ